MTIIPKSIHLQENLTDNEIRAYYSLNPLDEDFKDHDKRFSKVLDDYLKTKEFKTPNAKYMYKKQLKRMSKNENETSKKFEAFDNWRLRKIHFYISKQKDYQLKQNSKELNKDEEIQRLKKLLDEKDKMIESLKKENEELKSNRSKIDPSPKKEENTKVVVYFDSEDEIEENGSENDPSIDYDSSDEDEDIEDLRGDDISKDEAIQIFQDKCIDSIDIYHKEFMKEKQGKNKKEINNLINDYLDKFDEEIIQDEIEKLDEIYDLDQNEYTKIQEKPYEKMNDRLLYYSD
jgi:hypothetical protein